MQPAISVILPVYNAQRTVAETIASVIDQTYGNFEFLIINDGSTDGSGAIIDHAAKQDDRIRVWHQSNSGFAFSLNRMIDHARGAYLARIDADDIATPERFQLQLAYMQSHPEVCVLGTNVINIDGDGDVYGVYEVPLEHEQIESQILDGRGGIIHPSVMMRHDSIATVGGYSLKHPVCEDQELWLRLAFTERLANLPIPLTKYRVHSGNMSFTEMIQAGDLLQEVLKSARRERGLTVDNQVAGARSQSVAIDDWERSRTWAWTAVAQSNWRTARKHARRLVLQRPWRINGWKLLVAAYCFRSR